MPNQPPPDGTEERWVDCVKLRKKLPGLAAAPFANALGKRIYETISREGWNEWIRHSQMVINEQSLVLSDPSAREILMRECEAFLFGSGAEPPPGWVPPAGGVRFKKPG